MANLPQTFLERMKEELGDEFDAFMSCYDQEGYAGLRVNTSKISVEEFLKLTPFSLIPVPWTDNGFYYQKEESVTHHPHYFAGLYYIQEPSAMLPASRLPVESGDAVLDLCAAPGGKATELSSRLGREGLLIANDASASRAKALVRNLSIWGCANSCITGETPSKLLDTFGCYFDKILVDAPCSGEGMFRRDHALIEAWNERGPSYYASIQKEILSDAVEMLRPGGYLAYSTCTFSHEEDEGVIQEILNIHPELSVVSVPKAPGLSEAKNGMGLRIWPHRAKGEGHYLVILKKTEDHASIPVCYSEKEIKNSQNKIPEEIRSFFHNIPEAFWKNRYFEQIGEQCYFLPKHKLPKRLRYLRTGLWIGTMKKGRFEPSQALAMALSITEYPNVLNLSSKDGRTIRYLKGETIELTDGEELKNGWCLVCTDGFPLGWAKCAGGTLKNKYYPGWRLQ